MTPTFWCQSRRATLASHSRIWLKNLLWQRRPTDRLIKSIIKVAFWLLLQTSYWSGRLQC